MKRLVGTLTLIVSLLGFSGYSYYIYRKWKGKRPPKNWRKLGYVKKLYIYPLKSGSYVDVEKVECAKFGFSLPLKEGIFQLRDRSFMVYGDKDMEGKWGGIYNSVILIAISSKDESHVLLKAPGMDTLTVHVPVNTNNNVKIIRFQSWNKDNVPMLDCGDEASKWLSQFLLQKESGLRLGFHDTSFYRNNKFEKGLYANMGALLLVNEKSLMDLNEKLEKKVTCVHFRPNIVIDGPELEPFAEDRCLWIKIGDVVIRNFEDCLRCVAVTIDPETGVRDKTRESLKTLAKYRMSNGPVKRPMMGVYLKVLVPGTISVNDEVMVGVEE